MGDCAHPDKVLVKDPLKQKTTTKEAKERAGSTQAIVLTINLSLN